MARLAVRVALCVLFCGPLLARGETPAQPSGASGYVVPYTPPNLNPGVLNTFDDDFFKAKPQAPAGAQDPSTAPPDNTNSEMVQNAKDSCKQYRDKEDMPGYRACYQDQLSRAQKAVEEMRKEETDKAENSDASDPLKEERNLKSDEEKN